MFRRYTVGNRTTYHPRLVNVAFFILIWHKDFIARIISSYRAGSNPACPHFLERNIRMPLINKSIIKIDYTYTFKNFEVGVYPQTDNLIRLYNCDQLTYRDARTLRDTLTKILDSK